MAISPWETPFIVLHHWVWHNSRTNRLPIRVGHPKKRTFRTMFGGEVIHTGRDAIQVEFAGADGPFGFVALHEVPPDHFAKHHLLFRD